MENKIDITKLKAQDFMNELPEMVRSLEAVRSGSQDIENLPALSSCRSAD